MAATLARDLLRARQRGQSGRRRRLRQRERPVADSGKVHRHDPRLEERQVRPQQVEEPRQGGRPRRLEEQPRVRRLQLGRQLQSVQRDSGCAGHHAHPSCTVRCVRATDVS